MAARRCAGGAAALAEAPGCGAAVEPARELFEACRNGDVERVKRLVRPENVNGRDTAGRKSSPLHFAAGMACGRGAGGRPRVAGPRIAASRGAEPVRAGRRGGLRPGSLPPPCRGGAAPPPCPAAGLGRAGGLPRSTGKRNGTARPAVAPWHQVPPVLRRVGSGSAECVVVLPASRQACSAAFRTRRVPDGQHGSEVFFHSCR